MKYRIFFQCSSCKMGWVDVKETICEAAELASKEGCPYGCCSIGNTIYLLEHEEIISK